MQQPSLFDETFLSCLPGEARRGDGKAHQAATTSEKTNGDLNRRVLTRYPVVWEGEGREAFPYPDSDILLIGWSVHFQFDMVE